MADEFALPVKFGQQQMLVEHPQGSGIFSAPCGITGLTRSTTVNTNETLLPKCGDPDALIYVSISPVSRQTQLSFTGTLAQQAIPIWDEWAEPNDEASANRMVRWYRHIGTPHQGYWEGPAILTGYEENSEAGANYTNSGTVVWSMPPVWHPIPPAPGVTTSVTIPATAPVEDVPFAATPGTYTGTPDLTYQWFSDNVAIAGAETVSYTPVTGDVGKRLHVVETATNVSGSVNTTSSQSLPVEAA